MKNFFDLFKKPSPTEPQQTTNKKYYLIIECKKKSDAESIQKKLNRVRITSTIKESD